MKKTKRKPEKVAGVDGLIHTMSDTALRASFGVVRGEFPREEFDIPSLASVSSALRKLLPTAAPHVIERMVRDLVVDEITERWRREFDTDMAIGVRDREEARRELRKKNKKAAKKPKLSLRDRARGKR